MTAFDDALEKARRNKIAEGAPEGDATPPPEEKPKRKRGRPRKKAEPKSEAAPGARQPVRSLNEDLPYKDNLKWAIDAAGRHSRIGEWPETCPNDSAYYLFTRAVEDPKDFAAKFQQHETKAGSTSKSKNVAALKSVRELTQLLRMISEEPDDESFYDESADPVQELGSEGSEGECDVEEKTPEDGR